MLSPLPSRRRFLASSLAAGLGGWLVHAGREDLAEGERALVAVTLDLEMSRNFPRWEQTEWDYEKGNLNAETVLHCFAVGRTLEQPDVDWLRDLSRAGHPIGNHTYDHVNITATKAEDIQFRFRRAPWLIEGRTPREVIEDNIRLTGAALKARVGCVAAGFRTPGGFRDGLANRPDLRKMLQGLGFSWVSSKYPAHPMSEAGKEPDARVLDGIVAAQEQAQPFVYPDGLVEVPMSPVSDVSAFRTGRWQLDWFLKAIRQAVEWAIDKRAVFDFLGHPSCLYVVDPEFRTVDLICELARKAGPRAALTDLDTIARRAQLRQRGK
jgi:peptidoglycan/xylan/chitin deacetylase (PgdA/CDA1 family)